MYINVYDICYFFTHTHEACCFPREHRSQLSGSCRWWCPSWQRRVWLSISACLSCGWKLHVSYEIDIDWFLKRDGLCIEPPQKDRTTWIFLSVFVGFSWIFDLSFLSVALVVMGNLRWETQLSVAKKLMQRVTGTARFSHCTGCGTTWNDICLKMGFLSPISENGVFIPWYIWACRFYPQYQTIHGHFDQCMPLWGTPFWDESSWCMSKEDQQSPKRRMGWEDARAQSQHHFSERTAKGLLNTFQPEPRFLTFKEQVLGCIASGPCSILKGLATLSSFEVNMVQQKRLRQNGVHPNIVTLAKIGWYGRGWFTSGWNGVLGYSIFRHSHIPTTIWPCQTAIWCLRLKRPEGKSTRPARIFRWGRFDSRCPLRRKSGRFLRKSCRVSCGSRISIHPHLRSGQLLEWCLLIGCYALMYLLYSSHVILSKITFPVTKEWIWSPRSILQFSYSWF